MKRSLAIPAILVIAVSCNRDIAMPTASPRPVPNARFSTAPDPDATMGALSAIARHVSAGLRDSATRMAVARAMKDAGAPLLGLNLHACEGDPLVSRLLEQGERAGGQPVTTLCAAVRQQKGLVLYMDPDRLRAWNGVGIPIVTAIAAPDRGSLPSTFHGYRSPTKMIDLPSDGSLKGPMLVVLPYVHPSDARDDSHPNLKVSRYPSFPPGLRPQPTQAPAKVEP